jgi:hypothetical protein
VFAAGTVRLAARPHRPPCAGEAPAALLADSGRCRGTRQVIWLIGAGSRWRIAGDVEVPSGTW